MKNHSLFLIYLIHVMFLQNSFSILDLPHHAYLKFRKWQMSRKNYKKNKEVEDHWYFDIAYHFGTTITLFIVILNYSTLSPLIPIFGFFFFTIKVIFSFIFQYYVDKYNYLFVYKPEYDSDGSISTQVELYTILGVFIFQINSMGLAYSIF